MNKPETILKPWIAASTIAPSPAEAILWNLMHLTNEPVKGIVKPQKKGAESGNNRTVMT